MEREKLGSRLGFLFLSAGCAIGIGNVWKFPYMAGRHGGGVFVLFYLLFLVLLGLPVLTMEFSIGRASRKSPVKMYQALEKTGQRWHIHGTLSFAGNYLLMMFYTPVAGWMLEYFFLTVRGEFASADAAAVEGRYKAMLENPLTMTAYTFAVILLGFWICSAGLRKGLERITRYMMPILLLILTALAIAGLFSEGGRDGLAFYLLPDFERAGEVGLVNVIAAAMNQAFFTLGLGIGSMAVFGSYIDKERALLGEAIRVASLDTFVALASGLIVFPACASYGVEVTSGPPLLFITLPNVFAGLPAGRLLGSLFFLFLTFAAFSTVLAVFENLIACLCDLVRISRKKSAFLNCLCMLLLSLPCILGFNVWSDVHPFGGSSTILDLEDFIVSNLMLPLGSLCFVFFCTTRYGWGWENFKKEANNGKGEKILDSMRPYITFVLPLLILFLFGMGLYGFF